VPKPFSERCFAIPDRATSLSDGKVNEAFEHKAGVPSHELIKPDSLEVGRVLPS
jgi:hypothetical protein